MKTMTNDVGTGAVALPFHASVSGSEQGWTLPAGSTYPQGKRGATGGAALLRGRDRVTSLAPDSVVRGSVI